MDSCLFLTDKILGKSQVPPEKDILDEGHGSSQIYKDFGSGFQYVLSYLLVESLSSVTHQAGTAEVVPGP